MTALPNLLTAQTAAIRLGVTPATLASLRSRDDFPEPALTITPQEASGLTAPLLLWRESDIVAFEI